MGLGIPGHKFTGLLTESGQFESVGGVYDVHISLELELPRCGVEIVVKHRELEGILDLIRPLFEDSTYGPDKGR